MSRAAARTMSPAMVQHPDPKYMRRAIELSAKAGIEERTGGVFGAVLVRKETGEIVGEGYNRVLADHDPTAHGEVLAIRNACRNLGTHVLEGCVLYTSAEPCPMCYASSLWAHVEAIYYGATYDDVKKYGQFEDADFLAEINASDEDKNVKIKQYLREEAVVPWKTYSELTDRIHY
ncbi:hypothetical protein ACKKBG_A10700 [Auxenochlorella protothecoides x Auxenochlorella symbiontica]